MAKTTLFDMSSDQKKLVQDISTLCGVKQEIVQLVWQYTIYANYLHLLEDSSKPFSRFQIPFFGSVLIKHNKDGDLDMFLSMTESMKDAISKIKHGNDAGLVEYFQENFVDRTVLELDEDVA